MIKTTTAQEKAWENYREQANKNGIDFMLKNSLLQLENGTVKFIENTTDNCKQWVHITPNGKINYFKI